MKSVPIGPVELDDATATYWPVEEQEIDTQDCADEVEGVLCAQVNP